MASFGERARQAMGRDWDRGTRDREAAYAADTELDDEFADFDAELDATTPRGAAGRPGDTRRPSVPPERAQARKQTVLGAIREIPNYLKLAWGLLRDGRVSKADKLLVAGAVLYVLNPLDFIPDIVPFMGQVDDVFLIVLAVQRMISRAGREVVEDHWPGDRAALSTLDLTATVSAAAFFLPGGIKRRLLNKLRFGKKRRR
jgi:uncharacterized membrane protein YkvA (DUF1232 family)